MQTRLVSRVEVKMEDEFDEGEDTVGLCLGRHTRQKGGGDVLGGSTSTTFFVKSRTAFNGVTAPRIYKAAHHTIERAFSGRHDP